MLFNLFVIEEATAFFHTPECVLQVFRSFVAPPALMILWDIYCKTLNQVRWGTIQECSAKNNCLDVERAVNTCLYYFNGSSKVARIIFSQQCSQNFYLHEQVFISLGLIELPSHDKGIWRKSKHWEGSSDLIHIPVLWFEGRSLNWFSTWGRQTLACPFPWKSPNCKAGG